MNAANALIDGEFADCIDVHARGLHYGDGVFESIRVKRGQAPLWQAHLDRLNIASTQLNFDLPSEFLLRFEFEKLRSNRSEGVVKLMLARCAGTRGYASTQRAMHRIWLWHEVSGDLQQQITAGICLQWCQTRIPRDLPHRELKTLNALPWVMAANEVKLASFDGGMLLNDIGQVIGGTSFNVFVVKDGRVYTPSIASGARAGVMRRFLLDHLSESQSIVETAMLAADVLAADEVFVSNAVRGIVPVVAVGERTFAIGKLTQVLQQRLQSLGR